jgi:hypothetical protein
LCAIRLGGKALTPEPFAMTPNSAVVVFHDHSGHEREIGFLYQCLGVDTEEIREGAVPFPILDPTTGKPTGTRLRVMNPFHCMQSRVCNVMGLPGYDTPWGRKQLAASVICLREYLRDLSKDGHTRDALRVIKDIFWFCYSNLHGRKVHEHTETDPFSAVIAEPPLPEKFLAEHYPRMKKRLELRRKRGATPSSG